MSSVNEKKAVQLRRRAESLLKESADAHDQAELKDIRQLAQDLAVHQAELELQNEELLEAQDKLQEIKDRYTALFEQAPVGYVVLDESGIVRQANATWHDMLERADEDLRGRPFTDSIVAQDRPIFLSRFRLFFRNPGEKQIVVRVLKKSGGHFHAQIEASSVLGGFQPKQYRPAGRLELMVIVSDVSKRIQAEEKLRERENYLNTILQTAVDGFWVLDGQGKLIEVNEAYCRMSGYQRRELMGLGIADLDAEETPEITSDRIKRIIARGSELFETRHRRKDGSVWDVEVSVSWLDMEGGRFICFCRDLSERRKSEAMANKLHKTESLGRMAGAVAHNYNNLLTVVIGNLEMALTDLPPGGPTGKMLESALASARRSVDIGDLLLSYLGLTVFQRHRIDLAETCRVRLAELRSRLPGDVKLMVDLPAPGPEVKSNPDQLKQVLQILLNNAVEALSDESREVRVKVGLAGSAEMVLDRVFPADFKAAGPEYAFLEVSDHGSGIAPGEMEKLCDPFYSTKFTGRGMGLPVVLGIARSHDGCLAVTSEVGKGSAFRLYIPPADSSR